MPKILTEVAHSRFKLLEEKNLPQGVLAVAEGPFAFYDKKNRNQRNYPKRVWDLTLASDYVKEALAGKRMFGELDHPEDYVEIKIDKTAFAVTKLEMLEDKKQINGELMVLDTPAGRILNTLIRFGSVLGVSSRATGELDAEGNVIPESYDFITFDIVTNPSNEGAYPSLVESVSPTKDFPEVVNSLIEKATKEELKIIETLVSRMDEEMAKSYINKIEERRKVLEDSSDKEMSEVILDRLNKVEENQKTILANQDLIMTHLGLKEDPNKEPSSDEPLSPDGEGDGKEPESITEEPAPVTESLKAKPRVVKPLKENVETTRVVTRIVAKVTEADSSRSVEVIQAGKSK